MKKIIEDFKHGHHEFENGHLDEFEANDPFKIFESWITEATNSKEVEPNAFVLSTVNSIGEPNSRILYLKDVIENEFVFYTNYESQKGRELIGNPNVSMLFFWPNGSRQIRISGVCEKVKSEISDDYFNSRPRSSKIGAWASKQSEEVENRKVIEDQVSFYESKFEDEVPRPDFWGGYKIKPTKFEFWQGRPSRLHDRLVFKENKGVWNYHRINP